MHELIKIAQTEINNENVNSVNARELYSFVCKDITHYSKWIKTNLINNEFFIEGEDYIILASEKNPLGGRPTQEIVVTLDTAKELAMMTRSQKGKEIREYFIQCEKELRNQNQLKLPQTYKEALLELVKAEEEKERLLIENKQQEETIEEQNVIIEGYDECSKARRSKQELKSKFHELVRLYSYKTGIKYNLIYNDVYANFKSLHNFKYGTKIDICFLEKNIDYLVECVEIISSMINNLKQTKQ